VNSGPAWERLISIATLGTARAACSDDLWPDASIVVAGSPAQCVLRAAAATYLWTHAGQRSAVQPTGAVPAPADPSWMGVQLREAAAWRFGRMLNGEHAAVLEEWFELAAANLRILPPHWVPVALDHAPRELCIRFSGVLGPAALWLLQQNPNWAEHVQTPEPALDRWRNGTLQERIEQLSLQRARDPAVALSWLQDTWPADPPEAREAFVKVLQATVTAGDESFLEGALDDKRKPVRVAAAECLARLPGSDYVQRAIARADLLLRWELPKGISKLLIKPRVLVELPAALDKPAQRDGIDAKPPSHRKIGERAFWLTQMIATVPPEHWSQRFGCSPPALLEAAAETEYAQDLLAAWSTAAVRHPNDEWLDALCAAWLASGMEATLQTEALVRLMGAAGEQQPALLHRYLHALLPQHLDLALYLLKHLSRRWDAAVSQMVLAALREVIGEDRQQWSHARNALQAEAECCDVATAREQLPSLMDACAENSPWRNALESLQDIVEFRAAMQQELMQ
jgi:hypothetical protein